MPAKKSKREPAVIKKASINNKIVEKKRPQPATAKLKRQTSAIEPIRIIVEVIIRNETSRVPANNLITTSENFAINELSECPDNQFKFSFDKTTDVTILSLIVGGFKRDLPADSGDFTTCILDPHEPPTMNVIVLARTENPGGRAALSLSLNGKDIYTPARELDNKGNGILGFTELVKLPA